MKVVAWVAVGVICFVFAALVYYLVVGAILFKIVLSRKSLSTRVLRKDIQQRIKENKIDLCWWDKVSPQKVCIKSRDNLTLCGMFVPASSNKVAILLHGFGGSFYEVQPQAKFFHDKNFSVLAVDCRAHNSSQGSCVGFGWLDRLDVVDWVKFVNEKNPDSKIVLFGISMGGTAVCCATGEKEIGPETNVVGAISDCAFANASRQIDHIMRKHKILLKLFKWHLLSFAKRLHELDLNLIDATKQVKNTKIPILFIHGAQDDFVPPQNMSILYDATPAELRSKHLVPDAAHALSYATEGVLYEKQISDFLNSRTEINHFKTP